MRKPFWRKQNQHWYVELWGRQHRLSDEPDPDGGDRKNPPPKIEDKWHRLKEQGEPGGDCTVEELFSAFIEHCTTESHEKSTRWMLGQFEAFVGPKFKVSKLKPAHLTNFFKGKPTWSPATVRTCTNRVLAAINWGVREGRIGKNPISTVPGYKRHGRIGKKKGKVPIAIALVLEAAASAEFADFLRVLRMTGARPSELRRAMIERAELGRGVLKVPNKTAKATGNAEREILLPAEALDVVRRRIGSRTEGHIFLTKRGLPWSYDNLEERWRVLKRKVGNVPPEVRLYSYRKSFISTAINDDNINPALVAQLVGHVSLDMILKHYLQEDPDALRRAVEQIGKGKG